MCYILYINKGDPDIRSLVRKQGKHITGFPISANQGRMSFDKIDLKKHWVTPWELYCKLTHAHKLENPDLCAYNFSKVKSQIFAKAEVKKEISIFV